MRASFSELAEKHRGRKAQNWPAPQLRQGAPEISVFHCLHHGNTKDVENNHLKASNFRLAVCPLLHRTFPVGVPCRHLHEGEQSF
eukprot:5946904-Amphidinium_carterae.1